MIEIINKGIDIGASDIHIYPGLKKISEIKYRVRGEIEKDRKITNDEIEAVISLLKFNAKIDISLNKTPKSGRFDYEYNERMYNLRVSTLPLNEVYEGCVVRIFTNEIEKVDYSIFNEDIKLINGLSKYKTGLIIFSGPTGCGKSTSMYKLALDIAKDNRQIISIEDPIEKQLEEIIQMQVNEKAGINYDNALRSILRCDPDGILVGEIRDKVTAKYVITSTYSGHIVLTTLHAEDCEGVINRLRDLEISNEDLKQTLLCIISQRIVNTKNGRKVITELMQKDDIEKYIKKEEKSYILLKDKFERAYRDEKISIKEKEKWGY